MTRTATGTTVSPERRWGDRRVDDPAYTTVTAWRLSSRPRPPRLTFDYAPLVQDLGRGIGRYLNGLYVTIGVLAALVIFLAAALAWVLFRR